MLVKNSKGINLDLLKKLMHRLNRIEDSDTILIDTPTTMVAKTNFFLLKGLLAYEEKKGFYVALDRPHNNIDHLLRNHGVSRENVWYIDTVTHLSSKEKIKRKNVDYVDMSFEIENLMDVFQDDANREDFGSLEDVDFIQIENLSAMMNFNSIEKIEEFVVSLDEVVHSHEDLLGCLIMDSNAHDDLDKVVRKYANTVIDIKKLKEEL